MLPIHGCHCRAIVISLVVLFAPVVWADHPRDADVPNGGDPGPVPRPAQAAPAKAQPQAADELNAKQEAQRQADDERHAKQASADQKAAREAAIAALADAAAADQWNKMDPRLRNLIDPEATAAQYESLEIALQAHPAELLTKVDQYLRDDTLRLSELGAIQDIWEFIAKPRAKERTKTLIRNLQNAERPRDVAKDAVLPPIQFRVPQTSPDVQPPSDTKWRLDGLRAEIVSAAVRGERLSAAEGVKQETYFGVKAGEFAKLDTSLALEGGAVQHEAIERFLSLHPVELLPHVVRAYEDDKVTWLEYEVVKAVKEQTEIQASKKRLKAQITELWRIHKR